MREHIPLYTELSDLPARNQPVGYRMRGLRQAAYGYLPAVRRRDVRGEQMQPLRRFASGSMPKQTLREQAVF